MTWLLVAGAAAYALVGLVGARMLVLWDYRDGDDPSTTPGLYVAAGILWPLALGLLLMLGLTELGVKAGGLLTAPPKRVRLERDLIKRRAQIAALEKELGL